MTALLLHAEFERKNPDEAEAALEFDNHRRALHIRKHGSIDGYKPDREFPCPGLLHAHDDEDAPRGPMLVVTCDHCDYESSCRVESLPGARF